MKRCSSLDKSDFGGHAPATVRQFRELWAAKGLPVIPEPRRIQRETSLSLFDELA